MNFEFKIEDQTKKLNETTENELIAYIPKCFDAWNDDRATQLNDAKAIRDAIYQKTEINSTEWRSQMKLPEIYEQAQTLKAHLWENIYQNPNNMFDVTGKTREAQEFSGTQKAILVDSFENMKINFELDNAVSNLVETGEGILFAGWDTKVKQVRRKKVDYEILKHVQNDSFNSSFIIENKIVYDGAKVKSISPESFVFDKNKRDNWENCSKIYRSWATLEEICNNKVYSVDEDSKIALSNLKSQSEDEKSSGGENIELLEFWGDIKLADGTFLNNWLVVLAGRSKIIRFEANPFVINPFIMANLIEDPETRRGISPLRVALVLNDISSNILNTQLDALALMSNPPYLAPKGSFKGAQEVSPGKIVEYDSALMPQAPMPLRFDNALQGWEFIHFFKSTLENTTGIFKNMVGSLGSANRTATEVNYTVGGQSTRLTMAVDTINQRLIVPMVEKVADLIANFKFGEEIVTARVKGNLCCFEVNDAVRQADYIYKYGDRRSIQEKKYKFRELFEVVTSFAGIEGVNERINWMECFKYALEQYGIEKADVFLEGP